MSDLIGNLDNCKGCEHFVSELSDIYPGLTVYYCKLFSPYQYENSHIQAFGMDKKNFEKSLRSEDCPRGGNKEEVECPLTEDKICDSCTECLKRNFN